MTAPAVALDRPVVRLDLQLGAGQTLPDGARPAAWVTAAAQAAGFESPRLELSLRLTDRAESRRLNERYRNRNGPTNVLAFPAPSLPGLPPARRCELGDLVICMPVMHEEARTQGKSEQAHFAHLVVHGTLHLLGHEHDSEAGAREMEALEARVLAGFGFEDPYAMERGRSR